MLKEAGLANASESDGIVMPVSRTALIGEDLSLGDLLTTCDDVGKRPLAWWSHVPLEEWPDILCGASSGAKLMTAADRGSGLLSLVIAWNRKQYMWDTHSQYIS